MITGVITSYQYHQSSCDDCSSAIASCSISCVHALWWRNIICS